MNGLEEKGILVDGSFVVMPNKAEDAQLVELLLLHFSERFTEECAKDGSGAKGMAERCSNILNKNSIAHTMMAVKPITMTAAKSIEDSL